MIKRACAALFFILGLGLQQAFASPINLVANGDFELGGPGVVTSWTQAPDPDSLALGGQSVSPDFSFSATPHSGNVFSDMAFNVNGVISQLLGTTAGAVYTLEFDLLRQDTSNGNIDNFAQVSFGGGVLFQESNVAGDWMHFSFGNLTASGASTLLAFSNRNYWDFNMLDNVSVTQTSGDTGRVPEPDSALLVLTAFGLLGWRGRAPVHGTASVGAAGGSPTHTLTVAEMPSHGHPLMVANDNTYSTDPSGRVLGAVPQGGANPYHAPDGSAALHPASLSPSGGSQPHNNMQPYLTSNFIIAMQGIFPSQN